FAGVTPGENLPASAGDGEMCRSLGGGDTPRGDGRLPATPPAPMTIGGERAEGPVGDGDGRRSREAIAGHAERGAAEEERRRGHSTMAAKVGVMRSSIPRG